LSLFYGNVEELTTITDDRRFLPKEVYQTMVLDAVVCCVDILAVRVGANGRKECLLLERGSEPVKGAWWLPGTLLSWEALRILHHHMSFVRNIDQLHDTIR
jgi:hypothetical protein